MNGKGDWRPENGNKERDAGCSILDAGSSMLEGRSLMLDWANGESRRVTNVAGEI